ncbi:MAG: tRNA (adenosine(37)-N6)-threonylcarbamoyltransferase complex dimerization subunit type 1 TsaB [Bacilli bacterium]|nr:tRNA (adenosine(37)-N6)-threonylcarbamoyltransferase complex dimerization subunit type 1 TsaB [Bacilli bacterium]
MRGRILKYLFINSATANLVVAIIIDGKITYLYDYNDGSETSYKIMPVIENAFKKSNIKPNDIDKIFVVNGPGSFTGIRVGLTVAKIMAYSLSIPVVPISSLEVMASGYEEDVISLIDARRGYVYAGGYNRNLDITYNDSYVLFKESGLKGVFVSYDKFSFETFLPKIDLIKVIEKHEDDSGVNPHVLNPKYLKLTEAEEKRIEDERN